MDALTPARPTLLGPSQAARVGSCTSRSPCFTHPAFPPFRLQPPADASSRQGTLPIVGSNRDGFPTGLLPTGTRGFVFRQQTRLITPAESSFLSYGRAAHLLLLSTPRHHDAVAVGYKLRLLGKDFHLSNQVRPQAHGHGRPARALARPRWPWHDGRNISFCSLWTRHWPADTLCEILGFFPAFQETHDCRIPLGYKGGFLEGMVICYNGTQETGHR